MKHYSPNHPSVRYRQDNYHSTYLEPSVAERREAVRQRIGSRNNTKELGIVFGVSMFLSAGLIENHTAWALIPLSIALMVMPTLLRRINK